jgi:hypothetical protein
MRRVTFALRAKLSAAARGEISPRVYLIMHPSWNPRAIGTELSELMRDGMYRDRFVLATGDRTYALRISQYHKERAVIIPYVASERLDAIAHQQLRALSERNASAAEPCPPPSGERAAGGGAAAGTAQDAERPYSVYFVGNMHRQRGEGKVRYRAIQQVAAGVSNGKFVDRVFRRQKDHRLTYAQMAEECAREMRASRFCLAPAGDVPTSRRIPDAMAAGCLPVQIGQFEAMRFNLPFPNHVDWGAAALFAGSVQCLEASGTARVLGRFLEAIDPALLVDMSRHLQEQYVRYLSFFPGGGAPTALLQEVFITHGRALGAARELRAVVAQV